MCPEISRLIVSTDSAEIAAVARANGAEVPFLRPPELAEDASPMLPVLQHALHACEETARSSYGSLLLFDPTSPGRLPSDVTKAVEMLRADCTADGVVAVSRPEFNPYWHCVVERDGYMTPLLSGAAAYKRRQDVPTVFRINAALYLWRRDYLLGVSESWMEGRLRILEIPEARAIHIDDIDEFERADLMVRHGLVRFPWLETP
jgi:N-acylneuraminate cytidylyltransferase